MKELNIFRAGFVLLLAIYGFYGAMNPLQNFWFIHGVDLFIHEGGHVVFGFMGEFIQFMGGTLMQLLMPAAFTVYFWISRQNFAAAICFFWLGQNFMDVSVYVKDARTMELPLVGGGIHDWNYMLGELNLLRYDQTIGGFFYLVGLILMMGAIALGFRYSWENGEK